jgi:hypothetical protein
LCLLKDAILKKAGRLIPTLTRFAKQITFEKYYKELAQQGFTPHQSDCLFFGACELASKIGDGDCTTVNATISIAS